MNEYEEEFAQFDYTERMLYGGTIERSHGIKIKSAISELLRAHFRVEKLDRLSPDKDAEIRRFIEAVLQIVELSA